MMKLSEENFLTLVAQRKPASGMYAFSFNLYTISIKVCGTFGPMRKLIIPDYYTFAHLHQLILHLFGWSDEHLHKFRIPEMSQLHAANRNKFIFVCDPSSFRSGQKNKNEAQTPLSFGLKNAFDSVLYEYDYNKIRINLVKTAAKRARISEYVPSIRVVSGRGSIKKNKKYNRRILNEQLSKMEKFTFYPINDPKMNVAKKRKMPFAIEDIENVNKRRRMMPLMPMTLLFKLN